MSDPQSPNPNEPSGSSGERLDRKLKTRKESSIQDKQAFPERPKAQFMLGLPEEIQRQEVEKPKAGSCLMVLIWFAVTGALILWLTQNDRLAL